MSINRVQLKDNHIQCLETNCLPFETTTGETVVYGSTSKRQSLSISLKLNSPLKINSKDGVIYVTNKRLIFITVSSGDINSFQIEFRNCPILQFSHKMQSPWFGPNYYEFLFLSNDDTNISDGFPKNEWFKGEIKFNDGGLFEFVDKVNHSLNDSVNNPQVDDQLPAYTPV